ncbi:MAG TPA: putative Ig domain-containing protein [archaeon]|nr:putative Ig domain-containing protein [archaeon]
MSFGKIVRAFFRSNVRAFFLFSFLAISARAAEEDTTWTLSGTLAGTNSEIFIGVENDVDITTKAIEIHYDSEILEYIKESPVQLDRSIDMDVSYRFVFPDTVKIVLLGRIGVIEKGSGNILIIRFNVKEGIAEGTETTIWISTQQDPWHLVPSPILAIQKFIIQKPILTLQFAALGDQAVDLGDSLALRLSVTDTTLTGLTYAMATSPGAGAAFDAATRKFSWLPATAGKFTALFTVTDLEGNADSLTVNITVTNPPPELENPGARLGNAGSLISFALQATDPNKDPLKYLLIKSPGTGAKVDSLTGIFSWTPPAAGTFSAILGVTDGVGRDSVSVTFTIAETPVNLAPIWEVFVDTLYAKESEQFSYVFDPPWDDDPTGVLPTLSVLNLPGNAVFDAQAVKITWTPGSDAAGTYQFTLVAVDKEGARGTHLVTLVVQNVSRPPVLSTYALAVEGDAGEPLSFIVEASDPDGQIATITVLDLPQGATFTNPVFDWPAPAAGEYTVTFIAADPDSLKDTLEVAITISAVNLRPVFTRIPAFTVQAGSPVQFTLQATDPNEGDLLTYLILLRSPTDNILTRGATFDGQTFSWTPAATDIGPNMVKFLVHDPDSLFDIMTVGVTVLGGNIKAPPEFAAFGVKEIFEGEELAFDLPLTDLTLNKDSLTFWAVATELPEGAAFNAKSARFTWTPTLLQSGTYNVSFGVTNGKFKDIEALTVKVKEKDVVPVLSPIGDRAINENQPYKFTLQAVDASGEAVVFGAEGLPAGAELFPKGLFKWRPGYDQAGDYQVTFNATDASGNKVSETVNLKVVDVNRKPKLNIENQTVSENQLLQFTVLATDPDNDLLTYAASSVPTGATFTAATRAFSWTPGQDQSGNYQVLFTASDGKTGGIDSANVIITVGNVNRPPKIDPVGDQVVAEGATLTIQVTASDPDAGNLVSITVSGLPSGAQLTAVAANPVTAAIKLTPGYQQAGVYEVIVTAKDNDAAAPLSVTRRFKLEVLDTDVAPSFKGTLSGSGLLELNVNEGAQLEIVVEAEDLGGDALTFSVTGLPRRAQAVFTGTPRKIIFTPDYTQAGSRQFEVVVTDGKFVVSKKVKVTIKDVNLPPTVLQIENQAVAEGDYITFEVDARDPDNDVFELFTAGRVPFLTQGDDPPAKIRDGNVFIFDTGKLPPDQQISSAVFKFWAVDVRGGVSDTVIVEIAVVRSDSAAVPDLTAGLSHTLYPEGLGLFLSLLNGGTGSLPGFQALLSEISGFFDWLPEVTLLASDGGNPPKTRKGVYTYMAGDLISQFYGIRRGWGLDLSALQTAAGAAVTVSLYYFDEDLPSEVPNFTEDRISVFGYDESQRIWVQMSDIVVETDSNKATFTVTNFAITNYTLGADLDVVAPVITDPKVKAGNYTVAPSGVDTLYSLTGPYEIQINVTNDDFTATTAMLYYMLGDETEFTELALTRAGEGVNRFTGVIEDSVADGTVMKYYILAQDAMNSATLPQDAPDNVYQLVLLELTLQPGDVDQSGKVDIFDLLELLKVLGGSKPDNVASDVNISGKTDIFDLLALLKLLAG